MDFAALTAKWCHVLAILEANVALRSPTTGIVMLSTVGHDRRSWPRTRFWLFLQSTQSDDDCVPKYD
jgi:hypothetical protein